MKVYKIEDVAMDDKYEKGIQRGVDIGFNCLRSMFSLKKGFPLFVMAAPTAGKSEFIFELLLNTSEFYGWKHLIYSPETGSPEEIYAELCAKFIEKDYYSTYNNQMSVEDKMKAEQWVGHHFVVVDSDKKVTHNKLIEIADEIEGDYGITFDTMLIDPWNKMAHEKKGRRDDEYLEDALNDIILNSKKHRRINIISTHCRDQAPVKDNSGNFYYPPPSARDYAQGQTWFRMGFMMLGLWRPSTILLDSDGQPYPYNALQVEVHKAKPNGVATQGIREKKAVIYYNPKKHRYYEIYNGLEKYSAKVSESKVAEHDLDTEISTYRNPTEDKLDQIEDDSQLPF